MARIVTVVALVTAVGFMLESISRSMEKSPLPAGFGRGIVQGALMPMSFPNLLVGRDIVIYSTINTGVPYKLGYTLGVNLSGTIFFGLLFWRLTRAAHFTSRLAKKAVGPSAADVMRDA